MQETVIAFGTLGAAGLLPNPFDLAISFAVLLGLIARDRTTWGRHVAVFAFMLSRTWPMWINDPFAVYELCIFILGFGVFQTRLVDKISAAYLKELCEITYVVLLLLPLHSAPHPLASTIFCVAACIEWYCAPSTPPRPDTILRHTAWLLCMRRASLLSFTGLMYSIWLVRRKTMPAAAPARTTTKHQPASLTRPRIVPSVRVPSEYIRRSVAAVHTQRPHDEEEGIVLTQPAIESDDI